MDGAVHTDEIYTEDNDSAARFIAYSSPYLFWVIMGLIGTAFLIAA